MDGLDIGRETKQLFAAVIRTAETVFWNGPMGVFEWEPFRAGTEAVARGIAEATAFTAVGGGDFGGGAPHARARVRGVSCVHWRRRRARVAGGQDLPGVKVLEKWVSGQDA